jgi:hypothetical protein
MNDNMKVENIDEIKFDYPLIKQNNLGMPVAVQMSRYADFMKNKNENTARNMKRQELHAKITHRINKEKAIIDKIDKIILDNAKRGIKKSKVPKIFKKVKYQYTKRGFYYTKIRSCLKNTGYILQTLDNYLDEYSD